MPAGRPFALGRLLPFRFDRFVAMPGVHKLAASLPIARGFVRRDGAAIFDVLQGFVASQVLSALVELGILRLLYDSPAGPDQLALATGVASDRMTILLDAGVALRLLKRQRGGRYALARRGAAILGVPGLEAMIVHNRAFYADMADPVTLLRGNAETELARFWPYVYGGGDRETVERYSDLMAQSQALVAEDTLRQVDFSRVVHLMDVGGGSGAFLSAAMAHHPGLQATLVDLPEVVATAQARFSRAGQDGRVTLHPQSFREGSLPHGADTVSLVRVLYDHADETVAALLRRVFDALPPGGRLIVSEPMSGAPATDVYFAFYTMAMGTGRTRSAERIASLCRAAGFDDIRAPRPLRPYVTSVLTCVRQA